MRRRYGATLGLVATVTLVLVVVGILICLLIRMLSGGRELSNATDSGDLNIAKNAMTNPHKKPKDFANVDVLNNFGLLAENGELNLRTYNKLVGQSILVALNAKDSLSPTAIMHAKKVWIALNDVGAFLRTNQEDKNVMGPYFDAAAGANTTRMFGGHEIAMNDYGVSFVKRGLSTNLAVPPVVLEGFHFTPVLPLNDSGKKSPVYGAKYLAGYKPVEIAMNDGTTLYFSGVTTLPQDRPHLVSTDDFAQNLSDTFMVGKGAPAYPQNTLPANSFKSKSQSKEDSSKMFVSAVACAVVGSMTTESQMSIPFGYIIVQNGPSLTPTTLPANSDEDIFCHELAQGISVNNRVFASVMTSALWDAWARYNNRPAPPPPDPTAPAGPVITPPPDPPPPTQGIYTLSGAPASNADCASITSPWTTTCKWIDYGKGATGPCVDLLPTFRATYDRPGSYDDGHVSDTGYTNLEKFKVEVAGSRYGVTTCANVTPSAQPSGVKYFKNVPHSAPAKPWNFGEVKTAYDYLQMIDQNGGLACGLTDIMTFLKVKCNQILPGAGGGITELLKSKQLPLGKRYFIYRSNDALVMDESLPAGWVPNTSPDAETWECGKPYSVIESQVATLGGDGEMWNPYGQKPSATCTDKVKWNASSGYNNLLGELKFTNVCEGGGDFCQPN